jgi:Ribonuclease G/E
LRAIKKQQSSFENGKNVIVRMHPDIANFLYDDRSKSLDNLEDEINHKIIIKVSAELRHEQYEISTN